MSIDRYILDARGEPQAEPDLLRWAQWFEVSENRRVALDVIGPYRISTVFLGLDQKLGEGPPVLWETMVFGEGKFHQYMQRYCSKEDAIAGHSEAIELVRKAVLQVVPTEPL